MLPKPKMVLLASYQQAVTRLFDNHFTATKRVRAVRSAPHVNLSRLCVRGLNLDFALDALDLYTGAGLKLETLSSLVASHVFRIVARHPNGPAQALTNTTICSPQTKDCCSHNQNYNYQYTSHFSLPLPG